MAKISAICLAAFALVPEGNEYAKPGSVYDLEKAEFDRLSRAECVREATKEEIAASSATVEDEGTDKAGKTPASAKAKTTTAPKK